MRGLTSALLVGAVWLTVPEIAAAQVKITGGGEYKDRKGIHVRAYSTFPSLVRLAEGTLLCYDMASIDGGRSGIAIASLAFRSQMRRAPAAVRLRH
jgi:hypothetical protein